MTVLLDVNVLMALLWKTMNTTKLREPGFVKLRISERVQ